MAENIVEEQASRLANQLASARQTVELLYQHMRTGTVTPDQMQDIDRELSGIIDRMVVIRPYCR